MNNVEEVIQAISIGLIVASFLLNTNRFLKAIELCKECLFILKDQKLSKSLYIRIYLIMWKACNRINDNTNAMKYAEKLLQIYSESGERLQEYKLSVTLGEMYFHQSRYTRAIQVTEKALLINKEIGDRNREATCYRNLGAVYQSVGEHEKARQHLEKSLLIKKEIGDRNGEADCYGNLGNVYVSVGEYEKARQHLEKSLLINKEIGDKHGEAACYTNLGNVYESFGEYEKARQHLEKSLLIKKEIGDRNGEATCYGNLGNVYVSVGEYEKARQHLEKSLLINKEIGDKHGEAACYTNLGNVYRSVGKYSKANEFNKKAFVIFTDTGSRCGLARFYLIQGSVELAAGTSNKAEEYFESALAISKETGDSPTEALCYLALGRFFIAQSSYDRAEENIKKALNLSEKIGDIDRQFSSLKEIAYIRVKEGKIQEAISYFLSGIEKWEEIRRCLRDNDQFKISFSDRNICSHRTLSMLLCESGNPIEALYVSELSRARALADLMSAQYSLENKISADRRTWAGLEGIVAIECNHTCLYVSYVCCRIYLWILKAGRVAHFQEIKGQDLMSQEGLTQHLDEFFNFRSFGILPEELCEDRPSSNFQPESKSSEEDNHEVSRFGNEGKASQGPKMNLPICYKLLIAPVAALLKGPEIIIVPDRALYQIPFAALTDESGKYLWQSFRIRIVPSLTTLKLIDESPADYHCQTGALIVGNPDVGEVHFKGWLKKISRLPCAENEARMVGEKLGVEPLIGLQATKEAVLQAMNSVALIHIAAHGDAERGEIALAPSFRRPNGIPQEDVYLLTMTDISRIQVRAKLVVLSCCHSARGKTKAEGAVGIARAFLGSGARSVLVALWALDDKSTEQLMTHFYDHLVAGESAGESLHEAMKWMISKGYNVNQWAPFILIGDDVKFDFGKKGKIR